MRMKPVILLAPLLLAACAVPEARLRAGLINAGLSRPMAACMAERMVDRLSAAGLSLEERASSPHLTLGRWRESRPSDRSDPDDGPARTVARMRVDAVVLVESQLTPDGPRYAERARTSLDVGPGGPVE